MDPVRKRRHVRRIQRYLLNPPMRAICRLGIGPRSVSLLETRGRRSGTPRITPVGNGLRPDGREFWLVAEHGMHSDYVRNIAADPRVRLKIGRQWHSGTAHVLPDDDPLTRQASMPQSNARTVQRLGTDLLTVRIDLDP